MGEFEFIGISNGEAIVVHVRQGHVFRFKPGQVGGWVTPSFSRAETGEQSSDDPEIYRTDALLYVSSNVPRWLYDRSEQGRPS